jgi:hypothetical protein
VWSAGDGRWFLFIVDPKMTGAAPRSRHNNSADHQAMEDGYTKALPSSAISGTAPQPRWQLHIDRAARISVA